MRLSEHAKRLMIIHNFSGILRILIDTFFSIFILQTCGMNAMLFFYVIERLLLGSMFVFLSHTFSSKEYVVFYRIGIFIQFLFLVLLLTFQKELNSYLFLLALIQGIGEGFYWFSYNIMVHEFNDLDQRIRYIGYSNTFSKIMNMIVPITLGSLITLGSYQLTFCLLTILLFFLFLFSFRLKISMRHHKVSLLSYLKKVKKEPLLKHAYWEAFLEGMSKDSLNNIVLPLLIYFSFGSEFSLGILKSFFSLIAALVSYVIGKRLLGPQIMKYTVFSVFGIFISCFLYFIEVSPTTILLYNIFYHLLSPIRDFGFEHYAHNMIDIAHVKQDCVEHVAFREVILNIGRIFSFLLIYLIVNLLGSSDHTYLLLTLILTLPLLLIIWNLGKIEKRVKKLLGQS